MVDRERRVGIKNVGPAPKDEHHLDAGLRVSRIRLRCLAIIVIDAHRPLSRLHPGIAVITTGRLFTYTAGLQVAEAPKRQRSAYY